MTVYWILLAVLILLLVMSDLFSLRLKKASLYIAFISGILLLFFSAVRSLYVGMDTYSYSRIFLNNARQSWEDIIWYAVSSDQEIGYVIYNKLLSLISVDRQIITVANSVLLFFFLYRSIKSYSVNPMYSIFIFYSLGLYQTSFNISSSMIAGFIAFLGFKYIQKQNLLKFLLYIFFAFLFHRASIIYIVLFFLYRYPVNAKIFIRWIAVAFLLTLIYPLIYQLLIRFLPSSYIGYLNRSKTDNGIIMVFHLMILCYTALYLFSNRGGILAEAQENRIWMWCITLEICWFIFSLQADVFSRVAHLFTPALIFYIPASERRIPFSKKRLLYRLSMVGGLILQYIIRVSINNIGHTIPYQFFFDIL